MEQDKEKTGTFKVFKTSYVHANFMFDNSLSDI